ncbi:hypothetical protein BASA84_000148 [Batrachochytrium salamandrivorans]|nr:hypothetical protein BASA84_000148 [Batrachochytrium salamandrivorans]
MQFFYLFSFVVAASYAAALPQPAGLSEKYSNSADTTLASSLEARSYQPESNSQKGSATLTSLWQQDVFRGSSPPLPPLLTREDIQKIVNNVFKESDFSSANIASTIDKFGNGVYHLFDNGERARKKIGEFAGEALERYLSRFVYVIIALGEWMKREQSTIFDTIKSALGDEQYYKIIKEFVNLSAGLTAGSARKEDNASKIILDIIERTDNDVFDDAREIGILFKEAFDNRITLFKMLKFLLKDAEVSKTLHENMSAMITSLGNFLADQKKTHDAIMKELKPPPFEWLP